MSGMIERVARAIAKANGDNFTLIPKDKSDWTTNRGLFAERFRDINEPFKGDYLEMAEAAIEAMREPTEEMLSQMYTSWVDDSRMEIVWRDSIDAALSTSEGDKT